MITSPDEMRALASWYRERAEATQNPTIWESRLRTAEDLEEKAMHADCRPPLDGPDPPTLGAVGLLRRPVARGGLGARSSTTRVSPISSPPVRGSTR
jgi:hypothetical protein